MMAHPDSSTVIPIEDSYCFNTTAKVEINRLVLHNVNQYTESDQSCPLPVSLQIS